MGRLVVIEVEGGLVSWVHGLPDDWELEIIDHDVRRSGDGDDLDYTEEEELALIERAKAQGGESR